MSEVVGLASYLAGSHVFWIAFVVFLVAPICLSAMVGRAKGWPWWLFALFGLLSYCGLVLALTSDTRKRPEAMPEELQRSAALVKLMWDASPPGARVVGPVEVHLSAPAGSAAHAPPDLNAASEAMRLQAARLGVNAVTAVEYFRGRPRFLSLNPSYRLSARGIGVLLDRATLSCLPSDAEDMGRLMEVEDPEEVLSRALAIGGIANIAWGAINAGVMYYLSQETRGLGFRWAVPPGVIYALSGLLVLGGISLLCLRRPYMLFVDGVVLLAVGATNIAGVSAAVLGVLQVMWGLQRFRAHGQVVRAIKEHETVRARITARRRGPPTV